jgi:hypothetical protein
VAQQSNYPDDETIEAIRRVVREEAERLREESRAELRRIGGGVVRLYAASLFLNLALVFLTLTVVYLLGTQIEAWMAAAIVGGVLFVAALAVLGRARRDFGRLLQQL